MKFELFAKIIDEKLGLKTKRLDVSYNEADPRCWTAIIGKDATNIIVTYHVNKTEYGERGFDVLHAKNPIINVSESDILTTLKELI